jgi:hypothetical protein
MTSSISVAASLSSETRKHFAIYAFSGSEPVSQIASRGKVSRKFRLWNVLDNRSIELQTL